MVELKLRKNGKIEKISKFTAGKYNKSGSHSCENRKNRQNLEKSKLENRKNMAQL